MSLQVSVSKLSSPIKDLVSAFLQDEGKTEKDRTEVVEWIDKIARSPQKEADLKDLDSQLVPRTYLVSSYFTAADVALYGALHPTLSKLQPPQYYMHPSVTRYFDHIQSLAPVRKAADGLSVFTFITFNLDDAPKLERQAESAKKKEKAPKTVEQTPAAVVSAPEQKEKGKKEKKEKNKDSAASNVESSKKKASGGGGGGGKAAPAVDEEPVPSMIDLRVGHIVDVMKHPDADSLYVEQIDLGEETGPRTVVSGLVKYVPIEEMRNKYLVAVCNLKPASMRGVKSFAMVLCASSKDGKDTGGVELMVPPPNSKPGDRVFFEGFDGAEPLSQLNPKKKIWETIQPGFTTLDSREGAWINPKTGTAHKLRTKEGFIVAPTMVGASLS